jgi:SAM-dependent methyltransferase
MEATDLDYDFDANCAWSTARSLLRQHHAADAEIRVLDIGCHTGRFLGGLDAGWERFGVEGSPGPAGVAAEERGVTIIAPSLETVDEASADTFDVVTLFDVFEHLPDPVEALERCLALVRPGGLVVLSTGDLDALTWRICGGRHWYLQTSEHISLGSRTFFDWVSRRLAVRPVRVERIAHTRASPAERRRQWVRTLYWQCVVRGGLWRLPQVLMHSVPGLQDLRHMTSVPWSMGLSDHLLVVWERK